MRFTVHILATASCLALSAGAPAIALAQTAAASASVEELVVTARRREELLNEIPAAGTVFDARAVADRGGMVTLSDLANNIPSVNFANTSTPQTAEVSMRGSGTARATTAEGAVGLYRNGTYIGGGRLGGRTFTRMDYFDIERIEVLRGVQSALYGRNAIGGTINIVSARPQFGSTAGWAKARISSNEHFQVQVAQNMPVAENLAFRLGVDYVDQDKGFFFNPVQRKYFDAQHGEAIRGQVRFRTERLDANLLAERSFAHLPALNYQLWIVPGQLAAFPNGAQQPQYEYGWNGNMIAKQNQENLIFNAEYDLGFADLSTTASYRMRETMHGFDADAVDPIFLAQLRAGGGGLTTDVNTHSLQYDKTKNVYLEAHLADKGEGALRWLIGVEHLTIDSYANFVNTRTPTPANLSPGNRNPSVLDTTSDAIFGSLGYDLTAQLNLTAEARYSREEKSLTGDRLDLRTGASQGARFALNGATEENNTSYNLTAAYKLPWRSALAYAKYGTGFRAGGFNTDLGDPRAPNPVSLQYDSETSRSMELGLKGQLTDNIFAAVVAYRTDTDDVFIQDVNGCTPLSPVCPVQGTTFLRNAGEGRSQGFEVEMNGRYEIAGGRLRFNAAYSALDATIRSGPDRGKRIPQVPDWTFTAGANYVRSLYADVDGFLNLQYFTRGGGVQEADQVAQLVDFDKLDVRAGIRKDGWELAAFADNVTDRRYLVHISPTIRRWNVPRVVGVELTKRW